jgi:hypothetical protein
MLAPDPRLEQIDRMDGLEFEEAVNDLLELICSENVCTRRASTTAPT